MAKVEIKKYNLAILIPSLNEFDNLVHLIPKLKKSINLHFKELKVDVYIVDGITKNVEIHDLCTSNGIKYHNRYPSNSFGDALRSGLKIIGNPDWLIIMDSDGSHNPETFYEFKQFIISDKFDLIISSRYIEGGETENPKILILLSQIVNMVYRLIFNLNINDVSNNYRLYRFQYLSNIELVESNFEIVEEILIKLKKNYPKIKIKEIPDKFHKRMFGKSKRNLILFTFTFLKSLLKLYKYK